MWDRHMSPYFSLNSVGSPPALYFFLGTVGSPLTQFSHFFHTSSGIATRWDCHRFIQAMWDRHMLL
jgi:hypothetical protein